MLLAHAARVCTASSKSANALQRRLAECTRVSRPDGNAASRCDSGARIDSFRVGFVTIQKRDTSSLALTRQVASYKYATFNASETVLLRTRLVLVGNEVQLDFCSRWMIGRHILPLLDRLGSSIYKNGVASNGRNFRHRAIGADSDRQSHNPTDFVLLQFTRVFRGYLVDHLPHVWSGLSQYGRCRRGKKQAREDKSDAGTTRRAHWMR